MMEAIVVLLFILSTCLGQNDWTTEFEHNVFLDEFEEFRLYWTILNNSELVEIGLEVESTGWISIGISPNGQMPESDIIMGWIDDLGEPYLQNRYTSTSRTTPTFAEDLTDTTLISTQRNGTTLRLRFLREVFPCPTDDTDDKHNIRQIEIGTTRIIYAWSDNIPVCETEDDFECTPNYHRQNRGSEFINFLTGATPEVEMPEDVQFYDLVAVNYSVPEVDTTNYCVLTKFPDLSTLHHIIRVDPELEEGNEGIVHHIVVIKCSSFNPIHLGIEGTCDELVDMDLDLNGTVCTDVIMEWAIGRKAFYYPEHVGLELGGTSNDKLEYVRLNIHYDNQYELANITDNSGLRFYYTATLRNNTAMIMSVGYRPYRSIMLPGDMENIIVSGYCPTNCTAIYPQGGIHIVSNAFHAHLTAVAGKLRHIRNGEELEPIDVNRAYDNDYQEFVVLKEERTVLPGDELLVECYYNTIDKGTVWGGPATYNEMCHNWMIVYPKNNLIGCSSAPPEDVLDEFYAGATERGYWNGTHSYDHDGFYDISIDGAIKYYEQFLVQPILESYCTARDPFIFNTPDSKDGFQSYPEDNLGECLEEVEEDDGLETWEIVLIVIGSFIGLILIVGLMIYLYRKSNTNKNVYSTMNENEMPPKQQNYGATTDPSDRT